MSFVLTVASSAIGAAEIEFLSWGDAGGERGVDEEDRLVSIVGLRIIVWLPSARKIPAPT